MGRLRRRAGTRDFLESQHALVMMEPEQFKGRWRDLFGNDHPIYVELGMGKGEFVTQMSVAYPHINFVGIDLYDELVRTAAEKALALQPVPSNLALVLHDIAELREIFATHEVERFYLNFSDPWPKKRHARRRLTYPTFMAQYIDLLNENGEIHLRTDSRSLFEFSLNVFADMDLKMRHISLDLHGEGTPPDHIFTEYERKFVDQGMNIYRCEVVIGKAAQALLDKL